MGVLFITRFEYDLLLIRRGRADGRGRHSCTRARGGFT